MYLTPDRVKTMGLGIDFSDENAPSEIEIRTSIMRATAAVNAYCSVPAGFDFRGGTITDEPHEWFVDAYENQPKPYRLYPYAKPVKSVEQLRIYSTPTVYTAIDASEVFINNGAGYVEISSLKLTQFGIFGAGLMTTLVGMFNPVARIDYTYGWLTTAEDEILVATDAGTYRAQNQWWDSDTDPVVKVNDTTADPDDYTVDLDEGTVTFDAPLAADDLVTCTYAYRMPNEVAMATGDILASDFGVRDLRSKGMEGLASIRAGEIELRRTMSNSSSTTVTAPSITPTAAVLLDRFRFHTVR